MRPGPRPLISLALVLASVVSCQPEGEEGAAVAVTRQGLTTPDLWVSTPTAIQPGGDVYLQRKLNTAQFDSDAMAVDFIQWGGGGKISTRARGMDYLYSPGWVGTSTA